MFKHKKETTGRRPLQRTPQRSTGVFSYYSSRSGVPMQPRTRQQDTAVKKRSRRIALEHLPTYIACGVIVLAVLYASTVSPRPIVSRIDESDTSLLRPDSEYEQEAAKILKNSIWNYSKLTIDTDGVAKQLNAAFPELTESTLTIPLVGRRPTLQLVSATPAFILRTQGTEYYISAGGRVIMPVSDARQETVVPTVIDESNIPAQIGSQVLPTDTVALVYEVIRQFQAKSIAIESLVLPAEPNELRVRVTDRPYYIRFYTLEDARLQVGMYLAVANKLQADNIRPQEYIDVRVEERVYYK